MVAAKFHGGKRWRNLPQSARAGVPANDATRAKPVQLKNCFTTHSFASTPAILTNFANIWLGFAKNFYPVFCKIQIALSSANAMMTSVGEFKFSTRHCHSQKVCQSNKKRNLIGAGGISFASRALF